MREKTGKNMQEIEKGLAVSVFLLNLLILFILIGVVWLLRAAISANGEIEAILRAGFLT